MGKEADVDYLQTTGNRLHDLELDRILARLAGLEGAGAVGSAKTAAPVSVVETTLPAVGVRSVTPVGGVPMQDDLVLAVVGPVSLAQSAHTLTLTVSVGPATTVTEIGSLGAVGTAALFARADHVHRGVHKITAGTDATGDIVFAGAGVSQSGSTFTFSGGVGSSVPTDVLAISPGGGTIGWAVPAALTEFNGLTIHRAKHDLTNATQVRLALFLSSPNALPVAVPTVAVQYSANGGATWSYLDGATGPSVTYGAGAVIGGWVGLTAGAKADVLLRVVASGGDGATSLGFGTLAVQAK